jgi:nicotinic acid mononucleotide adenylyltransferase
MILTKMVINTVASKLAQHFKLDKVMAYVFDDNELDEKTKNLENRIAILESIVSCNKCNNNKGSNNG